MIEFFDNIDRAILLFLNKLHTPFLDKIMIFVTSKWFWILPSLLFIFLSVKYFRKKFWIPLVFAIICFSVTDYGSAFVKSKIVKRHRPTHNVEICDKIHIVDNYRGGEYGFFSGHAANSFGFALISLLFLRKRFYAAIVFACAAIASYSRIYLGLHYPFDILCGALYGCLIAVLLYRVSLLIDKHIFKKWTVTKNYNMVVAQLYHNLYYHWRLSQALSFVLHINSHFANHLLHGFIFSVSLQPNAHRFLLNHTYH